MDTHGDENRRKKTPMTGIEDGELVGGRGSTPRPRPSPLISLCGSIDIVI